MAENVLAATCHLWLCTGRSRAGAYDDQRFLAERSCAGAFRPEKSLHRYGAAGNIAQPLGEPERRFFTASKEIAQVPLRAFGGHGKLGYRASVCVGPEKHRMWF
jgi:hypothetical protein